jgi:hypothetical protein
MLDAGAHLRARRIGGLLRLIEFAIAIGPAMNAAPRPMKMPAVVCGSAQNSLQIR